jgi:soluble lytic murein transglycosylase-like protein
VRRARRRIRRTPVSLTFALLAPLLLVSATQAPVRYGSAPLPGFSDRTAVQFQEAAAALRRRDCAGAAKTLAAVAATKGPDSSFARLLSGFYAHACRQPAVAEERLFQAADPKGVLEDWRLYLLSQSARERGHILLAQTSLAKLLGDYPTSPLRPRALLDAATLSWERGDARRALELVERKRREGLRGEQATGLERLAWEIGVRQGDLEIQRAAARRLLTEAPAVASELKVAEVFRQPSGGLVWSAFLTSDEIKQRAEALLGLKLGPSALAALDAVDLGHRDLDWHLLKARALTLQNRGDEALTVLGSRSASTPRLAAALEWERAQAAEDVATARSGRANLPAAERLQYRRAAQQSLQKVAQSGADPELATKALRSLYADALEDGDFDRAIDYLRKLRRIDPADTTGAANLWNRGWQSYGQGNYTGAIGYWTELFELYPKDSNGRRGRYWTARAFEALGEGERATQIYGEVAGSDTTDFYRKSALARLNKRPVPAAPGSPGEAEPWPQDPALLRARLLTDLGLEDLATSESALVADKAEARSMRALEALILARKGDRRKSVQVIRDAFPALGGPFQATLPHEARRLYYPLEYQETIRTWAGMNNLPPYLVYGIIRQESAFDTNAQSWAGARGLMQLMPATARELAGKIGLEYKHERLSDPAYNVRLGTTYFSQVLRMFDGNVELALAGYNGGPYRIKRLWNEAGARELDRFLEGLGIEESKTYVKRILVLSDSYRQLYPQTAL